MDKMTDELKDRKAFMAIHNLQETYLYGNQIILWSRVGFQNVNK